METYRPFKQEVREIISVHTRGGYTNITGFFWQVFEIGNVLSRILDIIGWTWYIVLLALWQTNYKKQVNKQVNKEKIMDGNLISSFFGYLGAEPVRIFWFLWLLMNLLMLLERLGKNPLLNFYLACVFVQLAAWLFLSSEFEMELLRESGWMLIPVWGILLWFAVPLLKKEFFRRDSGGFTIVEEETF